MKTNSPLYCSLDIETSGFDPLTNEILEVGFVFFELTDAGVKVTKEWSQVFKPSKPVPPAIFGLTGISQAELDAAPAFAEHRDFLQAELGEAVMVGHNIIFDLRFLEAFGLKFSGQVVDTLDLVQFILPTHHSYNLENLMHTFGVSHKDAHRALADSKATLKVLEKLLGVYNGFSSELKKQIQSLLKPFDLPCQSFLEIELPAEACPTLAVQTSSRPPAVAAFGSLAPNTLCDFPLGVDIIDQAAELLNQQSEKILLVLPRVRQVLSLWQSGTVEAVFPPELLFDRKKFDKFLGRPDLTLEEVKFLLKVLVWQATNWQQATILDLNLSFFGGQFRELISGGKLAASSRAKLLACDVDTFLRLSEQSLGKSRRAVIIGASELEVAVSGNIGSKVSWGYISYLLKSIYNPELGSGNIKFKAEITEALAATDLFFGLTSALLQTQPPAFVNFKVTPQTEYSEQYQKIQKASVNFIYRLTELNHRLKSSELAKNLLSLQDFFAGHPNRVRWIELSENRCTFFNSPLDITALVKKLWQPFKAVTLVDALGAAKLWQYFITRLGLRDFPLVQVTAAQLSPATLKQPDLFHKPARSRSISFVGEARLLDGDALADLVLSQPKPAAVLFGSSLQVRQFYEQHYRRLKTEASVLAQSSSGGSNKLLRNFGINPKTILLATDKFVLKQSAGSGNGELVNALPVKTLVICRLPFEQFTHPYQEALAQQFDNAFADFSLPRAVYNLHLILKFFYTPALEQIYIFDPKLNKDYWSSFADYLSHVPNLAIK